MAERTFKQEFIGYYTDCKYFEPTIKYIPENSGVFLVYKGVQMNESVYDIDELIYIDVAENLKESIENNPKKSIWRDHVGESYDLFYSVTFVDIAYMEILKAALVFSSKPILNKEYIESFPFDKTTVICEGACNGLDDVIMMP